VLSARVASRLAQPAQCEVALCPAPGGSSWRGGWPLGGRLAVRAAGHDEPLFTGEVTAVELVRGPDGSAVHRVRGYDLLHRLRKRQTARVFEDVTVAGLAEALTADLGLTVVAEHPGPRLDRVVQHHRHDLDLLAGTAARAGLFPVLRGDTLHLVSLAGHGEPTALHYGRTLMQVRVEANLDRAARRYTAFGWHPQRAEVIEETASAPRTGRRIELDPGPGDLGLDGARMLVDQPGRGADEVAAAAQAALDRSAGHAVTLHGEAGGHPALWAGRRIDAHGIAAEVDGRYVLTEAVHTVTEAGWLTSVSTRPPEPPEPAASAGSAPSAASVTLGRVTDVTDPDGLGRVRVALPGYGDPDAGWLGVLCPGAGRNRGLVLLPDTGDTVLVALPHGVPAGGVVLGSLYGTVPPPDAGVRDGAVRRWSLHTADGQSLVVDDAEHSIRLRDRNGSFVELTPALVRLHANADLTLEAPGHAVTVRAATVDFVNATEPETHAEGAG
jgi:uncharacterized protein involved in type VI secretion and phage assembly